MAGPYSPTGPFTNGSSPGLSAALFNELERWIAQVDNAAATTLSGTTGTATAYMSHQGPHYKKVLLWLNNFQNTSGSTTALTLPTAFTSGGKVGTAHLRTPVTRSSPMAPFAFKKTASRALYPHNRETHA